MPRRCDTPFFVVSASFPSSFCLWPPPWFAGGGAGLKMAASGPTYRPNVLISKAASPLESIKILALSLSLSLSLSLFVPSRPFLFIGSDSFVWSDRRIEATCEAAVLSQVLAGGRRRLPKSVRGVDGVAVPSGTGGRSRDPSIDKAPPPHTLSTITVSRSLMNSLPFCRFLSWWRTLAFHSPTLPPPKKGKKRRTKKREWLLHGRHDRSRDRDSRSGGHVRILFWCGVPLRTRHFLICVPGH